MLNKERQSNLTIKLINARFIELVGPIGQLLLEDARHQWRKKQWQGPSAIRNYVKFLQQHIDTRRNQEAFEQHCSKLIMDEAAQLSRRA